MRQAKGILFAVHFFATIIMLCVAWTLYDFGFDGLNIKPLVWVIVVYCGLSLLVAVVWMVGILNREQ